MGCQSRRDVETGVPTVPCPITLMTGKLWRGATSEGQLETAVCGPQSRGDAADWASPGAV